MGFALTKIQPPRLRAGLLLARPALEQALAEALTTRRAVLLCAPAGDGKTALLAQVLERRRDSLALAWVSLDPGDDLHRLLECLFAALEPLDPPWRSAPEGLLAAAQGGDGARRAVAAEIVNALEACDVAHGVIVLDDLHHLEDPDALDLLGVLLQRLGPRFTLALVSRIEPRLRLARLRAEGTLAEFREDRLRFSREEAVALLARDGVPAEAAEALYRRTGGWAAGLRLALSGGRGVAGGLRAGVAIDRQAFDYLASEVLAQLEDGLREFLLQTSVLHELDAARCAALTGDALAPRWLDEIERRGLFASAVDGTVRMLRLHDLFRDALQHRLQVERPADAAALALRAASLESDPLRRQALLLAAGRPDEAARALHAAAPALLSEGAAATLLRLIGQFPPAQAAASAELQQVAGHARMSQWEPRAAAQHFAQAQALYEARGETAAAARVQAHRAVTLVAVGCFDEAGALLAQLQAGAAPGDETRIVALAAQGWQAMACADQAGTVRAFGELVAALEAQPALASWALTVPTAEQTACRGMAAPLARWAAGALAVAGDRPVPLRALAFLAQGWAALWQGRLGDVGQALAQADEEAAWAGRPTRSRRHQSLALHAVLALAQGRRDEALEAARTSVQEYGQRYSEWGRWRNLFAAARVAAGCGDAAQLRPWLDELAALLPALPDAAAARSVPLQGLRGTLCWLEGREDEAVATWREALQQEAAADLLGLADELRARLALCRLRRLDAPGAAAWLRPLLAQEADGPRGLVYAAPVLAELAAFDGGAAWLPAPARATLERWAALLRGPAGPGAGPEATPAAPAEALPAGLPAGPLTARELEVLALIARGDSNKLIARALDLSPFTVKRHVAHILDKLDLRSRGQAAAWYHAQGAAAPAPGGG